MIIPLSLSTATRLPLAAMRVSRDAEPLSELLNEENVSLCTR